MACPNAGLGYYPVAVGNRVLDVCCDRYHLEQATTALPVTPSVPTVSSYQFRETIAEQSFTDAAGQPAYRLVRAKRVPDGHRRLGR